jgi:hypothetical protein
MPEEVQASEVWVVEVCNVDHASELDPVAHRSLGRAMRWCEESGKLWGASSFYWYPLDRSDTQVIGVCILLSPGSPHGKTLRWYTVQRVIVED